MENTENKLRTGRRKEAIARVKLVPGSGNITINGRNAQEYFKRVTLQILVQKPMEVTNTAKKYDVFASLTGGGIAGQAGALSLGISRALMILEPGLKDALKTNGLLTRDPRMKERKKYGQKGARRKFQWTKR